MGLSPRTRLCLPPLAACALDVGMTLQGQPPEYWAGEYALARELNPLAAVFLRYHPAAFALLAVAWAGTFCLAIRLLPRGLAFVTAFGLTFGHSLGAGSWLLPHGPPGWALAVLLLW